VHRSSCKVTVSLVRFERNLKLLDRFSKNPQISYSMEIRPVGAELFHADGETRTDGRTDMTKLIIGFRNFKKVAKNYVKSP
jgi:hypothetical protein